MLKLINVLFLLGSSPFKNNLYLYIKPHLRTRNGTIDVVPLSESPLKLRVSVQGDETAADNMKNALQQIWHESIDFNTISSAGRAISLTVLTYSSFLYAKAQTIK